MNLGVRVEYLALCKYVVNYSWLGNLRIDRWTQRQNLFEQNYYVRCRDINNLVVISGSL